MHEVGDDRNTFFRRIVENTIRPAPIELSPVRLNLIPRNAIAHGIYAQASRTIYVLTPVEIMMGQRILIQDSFARPVGLADERIFDTHGPAKCIGGLRK